MLVHTKSYTASRNSLPSKCSVKHRSFVPRMDIVGLPDAAVQESKQRVQAAIKNAKLPASLLYAFLREKRVPRKRLVVNLAPAAVRKEGLAYDLPIAIGVLIAGEVLPPECADAVREAEEHAHLIPRSGGGVEEVLLCRECPDCAARRQRRRHGGVLYLDRPWQLLCSCLGSTSVTYRASDGQIAMKKYKPWGEVRQVTGELPTDLTFQGQFDAGWGLYFFQAR